MRPFWNRGRRPLSSCLLGLALLPGCDPAPGPVDQAAELPSGAVPGPLPLPPPHHPVPQPLQVDIDFQPVGQVAEQPRNILIISLDTVRADRLGVYGGRAETPQLSALAASGARFDQAISHFPETCLSHWSMLSGVLPQVHGNAPANAGSRYQGPTLVELAVRHGYQAGGFIGGTTLTNRSCGFGRGFTHFDDQFELDPADMKRPAAQVTQAAVAWIQQQDGPWVAFLHYFDAHFPYTPEPPWDTRYDPDYQGRIRGTDAALRPYRDGGKTPDPRDVEHVLALYDGELSQLDAALAPVLAAAGDDAIIVVTSDHGESFGHDYWFNHRNALWDSVLHVPLIIRAPDLPPGAVVSKQVGLVDLAPTVLDLAGLPRDQRMQGRSQRDALHGKDDGRIHPVFAITDPWLPADMGGEAQWAVRTPWHKLIERPGATLAYDLQADPEELSPLDAPPSGLAETRAEYDKQVASLAGSQAPEPAPRMIGREEQQRLEALGYIAPAGTQGPPGPPPGEKGGKGVPGPPPEAP